MPDSTIAKTQYIGQWVAEFERQYWTKKERTKDAELNYRTDYGAIFEKIDQDKAISIDRLKSAIANNSKPDTRTRVRWCNALGKLAECAELNRQPIRELRGNYSMSEPLEQRDIPELVGEDSSKRIERLNALTYSKQKTRSGLEPLECMQLMGLDRVNYGL